MDKNIINALNEANGLTEKYKTQNIREAVKKEYPHASDELAILRKAVALLFDVVATLHPGEINNAEFAEYHAKVEAIKAEVKEALEI